MKLKRSNFGSLSVDKILPSLERLDGEEVTISLDLVCRTGDRHTGD